MSSKQIRAFWQAHRALRVGVFSLSALLVLMLVLLLALYVMLFTASGLRWTVAHVLPRISPISIEQTRGSFAKQVDFSGIRVASLGARLQLSDLSLRWQPQKLWHRHLHIEHLHLGELTWLGGHSEDDAPASMPQSLTLPISVAFDDVRLAKLAGADEVTWLENLRLTLQSDGEMHRLKNVQFQALCGRGESELALFGQAPFGISGVVSCRGHVLDHALSAKVSLAGVMAQVLDLEGEILADQEMNLNFSAEIAPFGEQLADKILKLRALFSQVDLAKFHASAPKTQLDLGLDTAKTADGLAGSWFINNHDKANLPLDVAAGQFVLQGESLQLDNTRVLLKSGEILANGEISGDQIQLSIQPEQIIIGKLLDHPQFQSSRAPRWSREPWSGVLLLSGKTEDLKTQLELHSGARKISGDLILKKLWLKNQELKEKQSQFSRLVQKIIRKNQAPNQAQDELQLFPELSAGKAAKSPVFTGVQSLKIQDLLLKDEAAEVHIQGDFDLGSAQQGALTLQMKAWNPARYFQDWPQGSLNAHAEMALLSGVSGGQISAFLDAELEASQLNAQAVHGVARGAWLGDRLADVLLRLRFGSSKMDAVGNWGRKGDRLQLKIHAPKLAELGGVFQGRALADLDIGGDAALPATRFALDIADLRLPGQISVARAAGRGQLEFAEQGLFAVDLQLQNANIAQQQIQTLSAKAEGQPAAHRLSLQARGRLAAQDFQTQLAMFGGLNAAQQWRGEVQQFRHDAGKMSLALQAPVRLLAGEQLLQLEPSQWRFSEGLFRIQKLKLSAGKLETAGEFSGFALAPWLDASMSSALILGGRWALQGTLPKLVGQMELQRERGDFRYLSDETWSRPLVLGLQDARLKIQVQPRALALQMQLQSETLGKIAADLQTALAANQAPWDLRQDSPLRGRVSMELANLAPLSASFAPNLPAAGKMSAKIELSGQVGRPLLSGKILGEQLALKIPEQGVNLQNGQFRGDLRGEKLLVETLQFQSGSGFIRAQGDVDWKMGTQAQLALTLDQWQAVSRPDRDIVVDGQGVFQMNDGMRLDGKIRVVRGSVGLPPDELPSLGDDVIVMRGGQPISTAPVAAASPFSLNLDVNLGDALFFSGLGLEARLEGALQVRAEPKAPVHLSGAIRLEEGSYRAYGQNLTIERGVLSFQGSATTPAIDLLALRKGRQVEAGVAVTGTVRAPKLRLVSDPDLPDIQKLSWLILGRGNLEGGGVGDLSVLLAAGQGLLSNSDSVSLHQRLASSLGLDEVALKEAALSASSSTQASEQILALGKRLNDQLLLTYEQGLGGNTQVLVLTYQMTRHLSLVSRVGTETALDMLYTLRFDRAKPKVSPAKSDGSL